ncbi:MAG: response regulator [Segetibacter sp.]|jgi:CheY-like chemotaxis protein|nr:response regulator [Segetibacter sp.]
MEKENPIIIIDDDNEDLELISEAFKELQVANELICFKVAEEALAFLKNSEQHPLFILCDVNMNSLSGFDLREILHKDESLKIKSIPFLFLSTSGQRKEIANAYSLSVQGYFRKPGTYNGIVSMLKCIIEYWGYCQHPNTKGLRDD